ncbi:MAG: transglycosylase SLT domain-containing protein [Pseudomonadales bacterium]|nr:transglycosylase SLT domain-containing protein [Pseudomonadales bacterium]
MNIEPESEPVAKESEPVIELPSAPAATQPLNQWVFPTDIGNQRMLYRKAREALQAKRYADYRALRKQLHGYPLEDYLEYKYLAQNISLSSFAALTDFREKYGNERLARRLRRTKLLTLARAGSWKPFLEQYDEDSSNQRLRCHYAQALYHAGDQAQAMQLAQKLWLTPSSMPDECDPIFHIFTSSSENIQSLAWQRFIGAYQKNEITLANYLRRFMDEIKANQARQLLDIYADSKNTAKRWRNIHKTLLAAVEGDDDRRGVQLLWIKRLARHDTDAAIKLVAKKLKHAAQSGLSEATHQALLDEAKPFLLTRYALSDYNRVPSVYKKLGKPTDTKSLEWLLRAHIARGDWRALAQQCEQLPAELRNSERWTYWSLRARQLNGSLQAQQREQLEALAESANFYGFAAAKQTGRNFRLRPQSYAFSSPDIQALVANLHIRRALEHRVYGDLTEANLAWISGLRGLQQDQLIHAAYLASQFGWHQQAILTAARAEAWRHYAIRFPKVEADEFEQQGFRYNQPPEWFYATARQESALASNIESHAGAIGLMQLMPGTAKQVARSLNKKYSKAQLYNPDYSIGLGSHYLDQLYRRFGNRALSSAAYNAGPHRVEAWLKNLKQPLPLDAWIETIRFNETRQYVQNVLSFGLIHKALYSALQQPAVALNNASPAVAAGPGNSPEPGADTPLPSQRDLGGQPAPPQLLNRPWPNFSFLDELEGTVHPYKEQIKLASKKPA